MYNKAYEGDVCSHRHSFFLDNFFRRLIQNPKKIVGPYINKGDFVIDLGCGPGYFTIDMARMVGDPGRIIAVDLQRQMLEKVKAKAQKYHLTNQIRLHECPRNKIGLDTNIRADFILAYYMVHETPDPHHFLKDAKTYLKEKGKFLIVEPWFHISQKEFDNMITDLPGLGFSILDRPLRKGGRSVLLTHS